MNAARSSNGGAEPVVQTIQSTSRPSTDSSLAPSTSSFASSHHQVTSRPARKQISHSRLEAIRHAADKGNQSGLTYNIWYNKYSGGDKEDTMANKTKAETRCDVARDSGWTRADKNGGAHVCLFFARGCCPLGSECSFLHRLPTPTMIPEQGLDIFGREKHGDYRDDMGGVGSIQRVNRTLYVGRIVEEADSFSRGISQGGAANLGVGPQWRDGGRTVKGGRSVGDVAREKKKAMVAQGKAPPQQGISGTEKVLRRHFGEWGAIERVRVLHGRSCGFVTYTSEVSAQFAKEAMMNQSLDHDEVINLRWATEDPNPHAQRRDKREREDMGRAAIAAAMSDEARAAGESLRALEAASFGAPLREPDGEGEEGKEDEERKRRRIEEEAEEEELRRLEEENRRGWEEINNLKAAEAAQRAAGEQKVATAAVLAGGEGTPATAAQPEAPKAAGLLNAEALGGLQYLQNLRKAPAAPAKATAASAAGLGGLAGYGSDSDDDA